MHDLIPIVRSLDNGSYMFIERVSFATQACGLFRAWGWIPLMRLDGRRGPGSNLVPESLGVLQPSCTATSTSLVTVIFSAHVPAAQVGR